MRVRWDTTQAFSHSTCFEELFMECPVGFDFPEYPRAEYAFVLRTTLEGTKQGAAGWQNYSSDILEGRCAWP